MVLSLLTVSVTLYLLLYSRASILSIHSYIVGPTDSGLFMAWNALSDEEYTVNVMALVGKARMQTTGRPLQNTLTPPSLYVLLTQCIVLRYLGLARSSFWSRLFTMSAGMLISHDKMPAQDKYTYILTLAVTNFLCNEQGPQSRVQYMYTVSPSLFSKSQHSAAPSEVIDTKTWED